MPRKFYKHKLLLDEGFLLRKRLPILNSRFDVKHITADLGYAGLKDVKVYEHGISFKRLVVTFNDKDFREFANKSKDTGVIGVSANLTADQIADLIHSLSLKNSNIDSGTKIVVATNELINQFKKHQEKLLIYNVETLKFINRNS